tara:strand:- start:263 stop:3727 length:3465 start_codon:yes stop_codon:yes gene_type:complete
MINKRIFGSDLPIKVKKKLEARQLLAGKNRGPGEEIKPSDYPDERSSYYTHSELNTNEFGGIADLSSRTPVVRMWVGVEVSNREVSEEIYKEFKVNSPISPEYIKSTADKKFTELEKGGGVTLRPIMYDSVRESYIVRGEKVLNDKQVFGNRIYTVGNHTLDTLTTNPNESLGATFGEGNTAKTELLEGVELGDIIPPEQKTNDFLKPQAGITSVTSTTEGPLGLYKVTTVNFTVHNFQDFDSIYQRYFLRPGAQIFVDFGWNTTDLYDPEKLIKGEYNEDFTSQKLESMLYNSSVDGDDYDGFVTMTNGDLETVIGQVVNYDAKILENGSVECSVEIRGKNVALMTGNNDEKKKRNLEHTLTTGILFDGLMAGSTKTEQDKLKSLLDGTTSKTITEFERGVQENAYKHLSFNNLELDTGHVERGIGISNLNEKNKNIYISIGYLEDEILNPEFGLGDDIIKGRDTEVRIDSTSSFTRYEPILYNRQKMMGKTSEEDPNFLYPPTWDKTYTTINRGIKNNTRVNKNFNKIPIREIFVRVDLVINTIKDTSNDTLYKIVKAITKGITDDSASVFDLRLANNGSDNIISIIDSNYVDFEYSIKDEKDSFNNLFEFSVMSPNSIVKGYDLAFNIPEGGITNMVAIQGMSGNKTSQIFPVTSLMDDALATEALNTLLAQPKEEQDQTTFNRLGVSYFPYMGSDTADRETKTETLNTRNLYGYNRNDEIMDEQLNLTTGYDIDTSYFTSVYSNPEVEVESKTGTLPEKKHKELIDDNIELMELTGIVGSNFKDYYNKMVQKNYLQETKSSPLPLKLTLTIYGISSIRPGDIFRVDYLPKRYRDLVYFQTIKVNHNVDSSGWYTTLETQFRFRAKNKRVSSLYYNPDHVSLSPHRLDVIPKLKERGHYLRDINRITHHMKNIKILEDAYPKESIDMAFSFTATSEGKKDGGDIDTNVGWLMDYVLLDPKDDRGHNKPNDQIKDIQFYEMLGRLSEVDAYYTGGTSPLVDAQEPFGIKGLNITNENTSTEHRTIVIPKIKLIEGKTYHLLVKDHRWLVFTPAAQINQYSVEETRELALKILNVGKPIPKEKVLRTECEQCSEMYTSHATATNFSTSEEEQIKICEEEIGGFPDTNFCVWTDIGGWSNSCKANTENDDCYQE